MKTSTIGIITAAVILAGAAWFIRTKPSETTNINAPSQAPEPTNQSASASVGSRDKQVFEITVKEGYQPREITAKSGSPVVLKMKTQGTFDCSTVFTVPKLGLRVQLPATGETLLEIPSQTAGNSVYGVCGMGMYTLVIKFT